MTPATATQTRLRDVEVDLDRLRADAGGQGLVDAEGLVARASDLFDRILELDMDIREQANAPDDEYEVPYRVLASWIGAAERIEAHPAAVGPGTAVGNEFLDRFRANLWQARAILTPDDEFFDMEKLAPLLEAALEADRRGETEPLFDDEIDG